MYPFTPAVSSLQILGAWSRLADVAFHVSDEFSCSLGLPPVLVHEAISRVLGFGSSQGFVSALRNGAVAAQVSHRCACLEGYRGRRNDIDYLTDLAKVLEQDATGPALVDAPSPPTFAERDEDFEESTDPFELADEVTYKLACLREDLLYTFSISHGFVSTHAFGQTVHLAQALLKEQALGLGDVGLVKTVEELCSVRFPACLSGEIEEMIADEKNFWASRPMARKLPPLKDLSKKFSTEGGGWTSVGKLRDQLLYQPCFSFDGAYDSGPSVYLALANAPTQAAFKMVDHDGFPAISLEALAPNSSDIDHLLMCSGAMPDTVTVLTREEAEAIAAPQLAGWYRLIWVV